MLVFNTDNDRYQRQGFYLYIFQLAIFIFGLVPFHYGVWVKTEPMMLAIFLAAAMNCLWLCLGLSRNWLIMTKGFLQPVTVTLIFWIGWQILSLLWTPSPWRMWFGIEQIGEGAAWYLAIGLCFLVGLPLWQKPYFRDNLLFWAGIIILVLLQLHFLNPEPGDMWMPWSWPDYLVFMVGWFFIAVMSVPEIGNKRSYGALAIMLALMVWISDNSFGNIVVPYAALITAVAMGCKHYGMKQFSNPGKVWRLLAMLACLAPMVWVMGDSKASWFPKGWNGINARQELNLMGIEALKHDPLQAMLGDGWASFADIQFRYKMPVALRIHEKGDFIEKPEGLTIDEFHSHNQPIEAWLSLGVVGFIAWFAIPLFMLWRLPQALFWRCAPMIIAVTLVTYFWFSVPQLMAFHALFWVAMVLACANPSAVKTTSNRILIVFVALAGVAMLWTASQQMRLMAYAQHTYYTIALKPPETGKNEKLIDDPASEGTRFAQIILSWLESSPNLTFRRLSTWYPTITDNAHMLLSSDAVGPYVAFKELEIYNMLFFKQYKPYLETYRAQTFARYPEIISQLMQRVPTRENLAVPYLRYLANELKTKPDNENLLWLEKMVSEHPDFSAALWVLGEYKSRDAKTTQEGKRLQQRALDLQVEKIYPISEDQLKVFRP